MLTFPNCNYWQKFSVVSLPNRQLKCVDNWFWHVDIVAPLFQLLPLLSAVTLALCSSGLWLQCSINSHISTIWKIWLWLEVVACTHKIGAVFMSIMIIIMWMRIVTTCLPINEVFLMLVIWKVSMIESDSKNLHDHIVCINRKICDSNSSVIFTQWHLRMIFSHTSKEFCTI